MFCDNMSILVEFQMSVNTVLAFLMPNHNRDLNIPVGASSYKNSVNNLSLMVTLHNITLLFK